VNDYQVQILKEPAVTKKI